MAQLDLGAIEQPVALVQREVADGFAEACHEFE